MSRLEQTIKQCRKVWTKMGIYPAQMDEMLDSMVQKSMDFSVIGEITEEDIVKATEKYIEYKKEKNDREEQSEPIIL